jgi:ribonuclease HI
LSETLTLPEHVTIHFDGSCEPTNPGGVATWGWIISADGKTILARSGVACSGGKHSTNNVAEYHALGTALKELDMLQWSGTLEIYGDSMLVVNQVNGKWNCNADHLRKLRDRCQDLLKKICPDGFELKWIPREQNEKADALSREAYEKSEGKPYPERRRK